MILSSKAEPCSFEPMLLCHAAPLFRATSSRKRSPKKFSVVSAHARLNLIVDNISSNFAKSNRY
jgi:hypothetical protein